MTKELTGKVALVTGGARGIGAASAYALATKGADVAISYVSNSAAADMVVTKLRSAGVNAHAFQSDQGATDEVKKLVADVFARFGRIDIVVANAGVLEMRAVDSDGDSAPLDRVYDVNLGGVVTLIREASRVISDDGRIIAISSQVATRIGLRNLADYSATKAAVEGYVRGAARDLAPRRITVNCVAVGPTVTDMNPDEGDFADFLRSIIALGRLGRPEEIAAAVSFLASPSASFITGSVLAADGGINA